MPLPSQDISSQIPDGMTRVVFFNTTSPNFLGHGQMSIEIDGIGGSVIERSQYVQVFLNPGKHAVRLEHLDPISFTDTYALEIGLSDTYIRVYRELGFNRLLVQAEPPSTFVNDYTPVAP